MQELNIIFQNEYFVIVDKPALSLTIPGRQGEQDPRPVVGLDLQKYLQKKVFPVHRLDFGVSGLVMFAIQADAHKAASQWFESRDIKKTYHALTTKTHSIKPQSKVIWKSRLVRGKKRVFDAAHGQESITEAHFIEEKNNFYSWHLHPVTGRPHQLRYELAKHGYPIVGDTLYGSQETWSEGMALRAIHLDFSKVDFKKWNLQQKFEVTQLK